MAKQPIGIFDSGLGGLTILKALRRQLPHEDFIYFGDTANVPYGSKSKQTVTRFSAAIAKFLETQHVKLIIVACNTASALALNELRRQCHTPVLGVIEPGAQAAALATRNNRIAILGTEATVRSNAYEKAVRKKIPGARIIQQPCALFVPLVEENWSHTAAACQIAQIYLAPVKRFRADTVVLGCTHYPILKPVLAKLLGKEVRLIDPAQTTALAVETFLKDTKETVGKGKLTVYASDDPARFKRLAGRLLGTPIGKVHLKKLNV